MQQIPALAKTIQSAEQDKFAMRTSSLKRKSQSTGWQDWGKIDSAMDFSNGVEVLPSLDSPKQYTPKSRDSLIKESCTSPEEQPSCTDVQDLTKEQTEHCQPAAEEEANTSVPDADKCRVECAGCDDSNVSNTCVCVMLNQAAVPARLDPEHPMVLPQVKVLRNSGPDSECYDYLHKIILIGNPSVGKTNLFTRFTQGVFKSNSRSTIGVDFATCFLKIDDCRQAKAQIWDSAGMELYRNITSVFYRSAVGVMVVYDVTDEVSFANLKHWDTELDKMCKQDAVRMLIGNKIDLETQRAISTIRGRNYAAERDMLFVETSALASQNVDAAFIELFAHCDAKILRSGARPRNELLSSDDAVSAAADQSQGIHLSDSRSSPGRTSGQQRPCCSS